jgi:hypothetical protein
MLKKFSVNTALQTQEHMLPRACFEVDIAVLRTTFRTKGRERPSETMHVVAMLFLMFEKKVCS